MKAPSRPHSMAAEPRARNTANLSAAAGELQSPLPSDGKNESIQLAWCGRDVALHESLLAPYLELVLRGYGPEDEMSDGQGRALDETEQTRLKNALKKCVIEEVPRLMLKRELLRCTHRLDIDDRGLAEMVDELFAENGYARPEPFHNAETGVLRGHHQLPPGKTEVIRDILIPAGAMLEIAPGARLHFAPGVGIRSTGRIVAAGEKGNRIFFDGRSWAGILLSGNEVSETLFHHCAFNGGTGSCVQREDNSRIGLMRPWDVSMRRTPWFRSGGALNLVATSQAQVAVHDCTFTCNRIMGWGGKGGAIYCYRSDPDTRNCQFERNAARHCGGAVYCRDCGPTIVGCSFTRNSAEDGGAIGCHHADPTVEWCRFDLNRADRRDGAGAIRIYSPRHWPILEHNAFKSNKPEDFKMTPPGPPRFARLADRFR